MSKLFNQVTFGRPKRNLFDLSHEKKLTMNMGDLVPILLQEIVPGDSFRVNTESLIRLAPMVAPVMHRCNAYVHYFFVPNRLIFDKWETFITGGADGKQTAVMPQISFTSLDGDVLKPGSLADYMGLPAPKGIISYGYQANCLPFRAYQLIYNEYYRDQNLTQPVPITKSEGVVQQAEKDALLTMRKRAWEKDYFTSALPWSQRGDEVLLPNTTDVNYKPVSDIVAEFGGSPSDATTISSHPAGKMSVSANWDGTALGTPGRIENIESLDTQITINDLRRSARLQEFLEKTARGGSRLTEVIRAFFGVTSSDARLQRPEFLGGGKQPITISEVLSTFNNETVPGANMYGHGISVGNTNKFNRFFEEHGWIIGIMSVIPRTAYQQGIPKFFLKKDKFDLYWPTFAQLGEQPVNNFELYWDYEINNSGEFGYQSRYAEYKFAPSSVHGDFKDKLDYWHMGRIFDTKPELNTSFIECNPDPRIFAVTDPDEHKLYVQLYNDIKALRPMPYFNNPIL
ncbi:MAG: major capsid protein [Microviridae sp.]|nr:MAG: major capsid protein [Microviridae sp.]